MRYIGIVLLFESLFMLISAAISYFNGPDSGFAPLLMSFVFTAILGAFPLFFVSRTDRITSKESYGVVTGAWLLSCVVGAFPYLLWGGEFSVVNAWFETVSGFTTTGASILNDIEALPKGLLFWRSSTAWIGGIGVVMFVLVVMPLMGRSKQSAASVELSQMAKDNYHFRTQKIIQILLIVYFGLTAAETILLKMAGMNWFDALNHSFSTISTCGFSTKNQSIGAFGSGWIDIIVTAFMFVSGIHFAIIYATITGRRNNIFRNEVSRVFIISTIAMAVVVSLNLWSNNLYDGFWQSLRYGLFQSVSIATSTGFATANTNIWPSLSIVIIIYLSIQGASAGSTTGGLKIDRVIMAFKVIKSKIKQQQHHSAVIRIKQNGVIQEEATVNYAVVFIVIYMVMILVGTLINAACGVDTLTSFTASVASMGNIGPGFGDVGSVCNYSTMPIVTKISSTILMLLGRLEIFGLIQFFIMKWWV